MTEIRYKVTPPSNALDTTVRELTEVDIRELVPELVQDPNTVDYWIDKAKTDKLENLIELMRLSGYNVEVIIK